MNFDDDCDIGVNCKLIKANNLIEDEESASSDIFKEIGMIEAKVKNYKNMRRSSRSIGSSQKKYIALKVLKQYLLLIISRSYFYKLNYYN